MFTKYNRIEQYICELYLNLTRHYDNLTYCGPHNDANDGDDVI